MSSLGSSPPASSTVTARPRTAGSPTWLWRSPGEDTSNEWMEPVTDKYETLE